MYKTCTHRWNTQSTCIKIICKSWHRPARPRRFFLHLLWKYYLWYIWRSSARARPSQSTHVMHDLGTPDHMPRGSSGPLWNFHARPWHLRAWKKFQLRLPKNSAVLTWILWTLISAENPEALEKSALIHLFLWLSRLKEGSWNSSG